MIVAVGSLKMKRIKFMPLKFKKCKFHILAHDGDETVQGLVDKCVEYIWTVI